MAKRYGELTYYQYTHELMDSRIALFNVAAEGDKEMVVGRMEELGRIRDIELFVILAGGDGMLPIVLGELRERNIEIDKFTFVSFPFGSGNDLASTLGFGLIPEESPFLESLEETLFTLLEQT